MQPQLQRLLFRRPSLHTHVSQSFALVIRYTRAFALQLPTAAPIQALHDLSLSHNAQLVADAATAPILPGVWHLSLRN